MSNCQTAFQVHSNCTQTVFKLHNCIQSAFKLHSNCLQIAFKLQKCIQTAFKLHSDCQSTLKLHSNCTQNCINRNSIQTAFKLHPNCIEHASKLHRSYTIALGAHRDYIKTTSESHQKHTSRLQNYTDNGAAASKLEKLALKIEPPASHWTSPLRKLSHRPNSKTRVASKLKNVCLEN